MVFLLIEIRIGIGKNNCWIGGRFVNILVVMVVVVVVFGENFNSIEVFSLEVFSIGVISVVVKFKFVGEIVGMRRLYNSIGGF